MRPAKFVQQAKELLVMPDVGHFDIYQGKALLETMLAAEVDFFKKHML
jgi:fermentation-respiration switch protein FrsA (DUF1100 family)